MAQALTNSRGSTLRAGGKALPHPGLIDFGLFDIELIDVDALRAFGISDGGAQSLGHYQSGALRCELQNIQRLYNPFAANLIDYQPNLAGR